MLETTPAVRRGQWASVALIVASMALGIASDNGATKILADLLIVAAALVLLGSLWVAWRAGRRRRRAAR